LRCLEAEPARRPSAVELEQALIAGPEAVTRVLERTVGARPGGRRLSLAALAVAVAIGGASLGLAAAHSGGTGAKPSPPRVAPVAPGTGPAQQARNLARWLRRYAG
jgi:hypothetical protein